MHCLRANQIGDFEVKLILDQLLNSLELVWRSAYAGLLDIVLPPKEEDDEL